jgi:hypothetical protein
MKTVVAVLLAALVVELTLVSRPARVIEVPRLVERPVLVPDPHIVKVAARCDVPPPMARLAQPRPKPKRRPDPLRPDPRGFDDPIGGLKRRAP